MFRLRFRAEPLSVRAALRRAVAWFAGRLSPEAAGALELALAEVLNNIVEHAYAGRPDGQIVLEIAWQQTSLFCRIRDRGVGMTGGVLPARAELSTKAADGGLRDGGWGCHLVRSLTDELSYRRAGGENRLSFRLDLRSRPAGAHGRLKARRSRPPQPRRPE